MAENKTQTLESNDSESQEKLSFYKRITTNHPRLAKVAGITAGAAALAGLVMVVRSAKDDHLALETVNDTDPLELEPTTETYKVAEA